MKILFLAAECTPFYKVGALADAIGALPHALQALGHDVRVAMPRYKSIDGARYGLSPMGAPFDAFAGREPRRTQMLRSDANGVPTMFVWDERYFNRDQIYGQPDEVMAFVFFVRAVMEFLRTSDWLPDIIHAHEWRTALAPAWLDVVGRRDTRFANVASVYTIHNLAHQGVTGDAIWAFAALSNHPNHLAGEQPGTINWMARGIAHADGVSTVSPRYARDILKPEYGGGLERLLRERKSRLTGILNGIDADAWDPAHDRALAARFDAGRIDRRAENKQALQRALKLPMRDAPLLTLVSHLDEASGIDLLIQAAGDVLSRNLQLAILGTGEPWAVEAVQALVERYPGKVAFAPPLEDRLVRLAYAGGDAVLIPARHDPAGLAAMVAMRYGAVPIVHAAGGLGDVVSDATRSPSKGTGFAFASYSPRSLLGALDRALKAYRSKRAWHAIQNRAMAGDFSWARAAQQYERLYRKAIQLHATH